MANLILQAMRQPKQSSSLKSQFEQFLKDNAGKTPDQIAKEHNIDMGYVNLLLNQMKQK